jgi:hypothetical protein
MESFFDSFSGSFAMMFEYMVNEIEIGHEMLCLRN